MPEVYTQSSLLEPMKRCALCGKMKPLDAFHRMSTVKSGYRAQCKLCRSPKKILRSALHARGLHHCTKCGQDKPFADFRNQRGRDGLDSHCRACEAIDQRADRQANPEKYAARERRRDPEKQRARWKRHGQIRTQRRREAREAYYIAHPGELAERRRFQQMAAAERAIARRKQWRQDHAEELSARHKQWLEDHAEQVIETCRRYYQAHQEKLRRYSSEYSKAHPEQARAHVYLRRARKRGAPICDLTVAQWKAIKEAYEYRCAYCGCLPERLTQDHVIPLSRGGSHTASNIVPACHSCNSSKQAKTPEEWNGPHGRRLAKQTRSP